MSQKVSPLQNREIKLPRKFPVYKVEKTNGFPKENKLNIIIFSYLTGEIVMLSLNIKIFRADAKQIQNELSTLQATGAFPAKSNHYFKNAVVWNSELC